MALDALEIPRSQSICTHALAQPTPLVIPDVAHDPRASDSLAARRDPPFRFYAGMRLATPEGVGLGALCVMDHAPRPHGLTPEQSDALARLARQVMSLLELRRALFERDAAADQVTEADTRHRQIMDSAVHDAIVTIDLDGRVTGWSAGAEATLGWSEAEMLGESADRLFSIEDRDAGLPEAEMAAARADGRATPSAGRSARTGPASSPPGSSCR